ncbi:MAG: biotin/lipoyl-binding protein [Vicinamibacterales bacterium]
MTRRAWTVVVAVGLASVAVLVGGGRQAAGDPVTETNETVSSTRPLIAGPGRVEPVSEEIDVAPELSGKLIDVAVDEGDAVRAGDVIARLEAEEFDARLRAAEARVAVAEAERLRLANGARPGRTPGGAGGRRAGGRRAGARGHGAGAEPAPVRRRRDPARAAGPRGS